jgi:GNAT superfamily N-acetyltransferase
MTRSTPNTQVPKNLTITFNKPVIASDLDWQLSQEINVATADGKVIAKAEIELITLNKHRDAVASYELLDCDEGTDWEIPLNLYFTKQNLSADLCGALLVQADIKAKTHIMLEALSVHPDYRKQGIARYLFTEIAKHHNKAQSISVMSMPMPLFLDSATMSAEQGLDADNISYYQSLKLADEKITADDLGHFFKAIGFNHFEIDPTLLAEPLGFDVYVTSPAKLLADIK